MNPMHPPEALINLTCGHTDQAEYLRSGQEVATEFALASERYLKKQFSDFSNILDFGCGAGRLLGCLNFGEAKVTGCDVGKSVSEYAHGAFPNYRIVRTDFHPPLPFESGEFDLVYSFSVFSHLSQKVEEEWLRELSRIGAPGAAYLLTIHGDWFIEATLSAEDQIAARRDGFYYREVHKRGSEEDHPDQYEASYHTSSYVWREWSKFFEIIDVIKGDNPNRYLFDGKTFESQGGNVPDFRPMGQDLVVARRRDA